ncbi:hypothetical protein Tco_0686524 [Tanacetum coccineum]
MDDPNITMEEYIRLEEEKARRRAIVFNEALTSEVALSCEPTVNLKTDSENDNDKVNMPSFLSSKPTVSYFEDIDYFKDFENQFPAIVYNDALTSEREISSHFENEFLAIVYNDALTSELEVSSEPTVSAYPAIKVDFDLKISSSDSDDEYYTFIYDKNSFSYKLVYINDLKSDSNNVDDKIDIK